MSISSSTPLTRPNSLTPSRPPVQASTSTLEPTSTIYTMSQGRFGDLEHSPSPAFPTSSRSTRTLLEGSRQLSPTPSQACTTIPENSQRPVPDSLSFTLSPPPGFEPRSQSSQEEPTISFDRRGSRDDPTKAFRGSPTPFFMPRLSPSHEPPFASSSVSSDGTVMAREASWIQNQSQSAWSRRDGEGVEGIWHDQVESGTRETNSSEMDGTAQDTRNVGTDQMKVCPSLISSLITEVMLISRIDRSSSRNLLNFPPRLITKSAISPTLSTVFIIEYVTSSNNLWTRTVISKV